jgi:Zn-dependent protease
MTPIPTHCPHCSSPLGPGELACPNCRRWVYEDRLRQLLEEASQSQHLNPVYAASLLREAMSLVPPDSPPYQTLGQQADALAARASGGSGPTMSYVPAQAKTETPLSAILKTGGSMALSIWVYHYESHSWIFAIGFVFLILIHEMGHVIANWYLGVKQSPPIFIPYVGAIIWLRQSPRDAKAEAVTGIAGPVAGTLGALLCYAVYLYTGKPLFGVLSGFAALMNLFNMIPIAPLDGGRVAAAITPWLWIPGLLMFLAALFAFGGGHVDFVTILVAFWILRGAWPRLRQVLFSGAANHPYYRVGLVGRLYVIFSYVLLTGLLVAILYQSRLYEVLKL